MFRVGVFDHPPAPEPQALAANVETPDELAFALKLGEEGSVLLKNDRQRAADHRLRARRSP